MHIPLEVTIKDFEIRERLWLREKIIIDGDAVMAGMFAFVGGREIPIIRDDAIEHIYPIRFDLANWMQNM